MMESNQIYTENRDIAAKATWVLWYQDLFDRDCPRKVEVRGQGLVQGLAELWARHLFETVQANGHRGFSCFNLWWEQKQKSIEIKGAWQGMVRLRRWIFGNRRTANQDCIDDGDRELLMEIALAHSCLVLAEKTSEGILTAAKNCENPEVFQEKLVVLKEVSTRKVKND